MFLFAPTLNSVDVHFDNPNLEANAFML